MIVSKLLIDNNLKVLYGELFDPLSIGFMLVYDRVDNFVDIVEDCFVFTMCVFDCFVYLPKLFLKGVVVFVLSASHILSGQILAIEYLYIILVANRRSFHTD